LRNARRNPVRSILTIASTAICLFLMMILLAFFAINNEVAENSRINNRIVVMNANGFAGMVPIGFVGEVSKMDGVVSATPFSWYGGKYHDEVMPFSQFAVDAQIFFTVWDELAVPPSQLKDFKENKDGCVIGSKLASDRRLKVGDPLPLKGDYYPVDMDLTVRGIYSGPSKTDQRMCLFHFDYLDEALKKTAMSAASGGSLTPSSAKISGNAGVIYVKCKNADIMPSLNKKIDDLYRNSDFPTRSQTEEAFNKMFADMLGDLKWAIYGIGLAVVVALLFVAGNAMAMAMRERTSEVAVLKAIGFPKGLVLFLVLTEAVLVAGLGGAIGALGSKAFFDYVDIAPYTGGFLPFFYVSWNLAIFGLCVSLFVGFASGLFPALIAANSSVINGLRKVV
jgi:putative ABC transport system permease protein